MGDMQAERLHHGLPVLKVKNIILVDILRVELPRLRQRKQFPGYLPLFSVRAGKLSQSLCRSFHKSFRNVFFLIGISYAFLLPGFPDRLKQRHCLIAQLVHHMNTAAVDIQNDRISVVGILMYHKIILFRQTPPTPQRSSEISRCLPET